MKNFILVIGFLIAFLPVISEGARPSRNLCLNEGWRFQIATSQSVQGAKGHASSYLSAKTGEASGPAGSSFDDTEWRIVNLPHDWVVGGLFSPDANSSQGYRPGGLAWYRRYLEIPENLKGKHFELVFDGVASHATVWINGALVARSYSGYVPLTIDVTPFLRYGSLPNTIAVQVDADAHEGWWYEGGGIYRDVMLKVRDSLHIVTDGIRSLPTNVREDDWLLPVETTVANFGDVDAEVIVQAELIDANDKVVVKGETPATLPALGSAKATVELPVHRPKLWSLESPNLYRTRVLIFRAGTMTDMDETVCGFRTIRFDAQKGFFLNDKRVEIQGTANHQDSAGVGVAVPPALWDFRVKKLKEMGCNAYRSAHNPATPILDACDRLGMLVMDENRTFNSSPWAMEQIQAMIKRDRNHPSIILWSIFNEELWQDTEQGREIGRRLAAEIRRLDNTRPITAAMNNGCSDKDGVPQILDVVGANYPDCQHADQFHQDFPEKPMIGSEDTSALAMRGVYETVPSRQLISSYDTEKVRWGMLNRDVLKYYSERPWLAGGFSWTGFDYRGETTPYNWPQVICDFGIADLCGFPKTAFYIRQSQWVKDRNILAIAPHWNWPGKEGKPIKVVVISNAKKVSLSLNGNFLGEKEVPAFDYAVWEVPYAPGKLEAVAFTDGREVAHATVETTGPAVTLRMLPDRKTLLGDGRDAMPITIEAVDAQGRAVPNSNAKVTFAVEGPGENIGHGNGDPNCHDPEQGPDRQLFNGLAQLIVRSKKGQQGALKIHATSPGLAPAVVTITVSTAPEIPAIAPIFPDYPIAHWRMSPASPAKPDFSAQIDESDMNTWTMPSVGRTQRVRAHDWALYRAVFTPWKGIAKQGGIVQLRQVSGMGEVWLDGKCVHTKTDPAPGDLRFDLPPGNGSRSLVLLLQAGSDGKIGFGGSAGISLPNAVHNNE